MPETLFRTLIRVAFGLVIITTGFAPATAASVHLRNARTEPVSFAQLEGWKDDDQKAAFDTFLKSCSAVLNGTRAMRAARPLYGALFKVCERAVSAGEVNRDRARVFFEDNFKLMRVIPAGQTQGFFTGYYETEVDGSRFPSDEYSVPIYTAPAETVRKRQSKVFAE